MFQSNGFSSVCIDEYILILASNLIINKEIAWKVLLQLFGWPAYRGLLRLMCAC